MFLTLCLKFSIEFRMPLFLTTTSTLLNDCKSKDRLKLKGLLLGWTATTPNCASYPLGVWSQLSPQLTKFQAASEIPARFIERSVSLRGKVHGITERGVEVEHLPIHLPVLSQLLTKSKGNDALSSCTKPTHPKSCYNRYFWAMASATFGDIV